MLVYVRYCSVRNTKFPQQCVESPKCLSLHEYFSNSKTDVSFAFEADDAVASGLKEEVNLLAAKFPPRCPPCCFAKILPRAQCTYTFDISADRNVWLQPALRSFAVVCDYMETALFAIVCDLRSSAIIWKPALRINVIPGLKGFNPRLVISKFHSKNRYRTHRFAIHAISVFQVKFTVEFTSWAMNYYIEETGNTKTRTIRKPFIFTNPTGSKNK